MPESADYSVSWSQRAIDSLKSFAKNLSGVDARLALAKLVRQVDIRLRENPLEFGEIYRSRANVREHLAVQEYLAVDFAIDESHKFVLVRDCRPLSQ